MKKTLMGASAVALATAHAGGAQAAEWDLTWGGFYNAYAVYTGDDTTDDTDGFDIKTNSEIHFKPSITLDNGLTFGARVELEGDGNQNNVDDIDESFAYVSGSFGCVQMGAVDSPFNEMGVTGPTYGPMGVSSATMTGTYMSDGFGASGIRPQLAGDAVRINYYTPRFAGFQVGVGYARGTSRQEKFATSYEPRNDANRHDIWSIAAGYSNTWGNVSFDAGLGYEQADGAGAGVSPRNYGLGLNVGFSGFEIGGAYSRVDRDTGGNDEIDFFDAAIGYSTGPWGVSLGASYTDFDSTYETTQVALNGRYTLGPGVTAVAFAGWADQDFDGGNDKDGYIIGTGFNLGF